MKVNFLFFILIFFSSSSIGQTKDFKVFNALLFKNTPYDLTEYGFSKFNIIYEDGVISTNYHEKNTKSPFWRYVDYQKVGKQARLSRLNKNIPTCLDVEHWDLNNSKTRQYGENQYVSLINSYRSLDKNSMVSVFHYGAISQKINSSSNVVFPAFYTDSSDFTAWKAKVIYFMNNLKKMNNKNPVYAFIWPQYNPTNKTNLGFKFIERDLWRRQLEFLYQNCDGVVIWSHYRDQNNKNIYFNTNMPWFVETRNFIKKYNIQSIK